MSPNRRPDANRLVDSWIERLRSSQTPIGSMPDYLKEAADAEEMTPEQAESFRAALIGFRRTASALGEDEEPDIQELGDTKFLFPLGDVLDALPEKYVLDSRLSAEERARKVEIIVENLVDQLAKGQVRISASRLVYGVPAGIIHSDAFRDDMTMITLPLPAVVAALDPKLLARWTAKSTVSYKMDSLPDPFDLESGAGPDGGISPAEALPAKTDVATPEKPGGERALEVEAARSAEDSDQETVVPPEKAEGETISEWLSGLNLNTADADHLMRLDGVTARVAGNIVAYRSANGPFRDIFALYRVPGVGRKTFKKITGMSFSRTGRHRRRNLSALLGLSASEVAHLPTVVKTVASQPGFTGCLISDRDGLMLSESGVGGRATALAAIVPRMSRQLADNFTEIGGSCVQSFSICVDGRMHTVIGGRKIYLTAMHSANRLTAKHLKFLRRTAGELEWLLSERGYVSRETEE